MSEIVKALTLKWPFEWVGTRVGGRPLWRRRRQLMGCVGGVLASILQAMTREVASHYQGKCSLCWQKTTAAHRVVSCAACGKAVHVACAFPGLRARRSPLFSGYTCDDCVEYELELGFDRLEGTREPAGPGGRLALVLRALLGPSRTGPFPSSPPPPRARPPGPPPPPASTSAPWAAWSRCPARATWCASTWRRPCRPATPTA